ncbi:nickel/cobalt transporter [Microvirga sp. 2MCAF38]|uniref:nickel/cobalt transporter n=1 Tax=Microvirga sp. 2MCAF38 TaxID=3232989 RepID=UPI003F94DB88
MSVTAEPLGVVQTVRGRFWQRVVLAVAATAFIAGIVALFVWWLAPAAPPPVKNPFGVGVREAAPSGALGSYILSIQAGFYKSLQASVRELKENGAALWSLLLVGFAYGVFHAAGPGHGKAVISAYLIADQKALRKGFTLSLAAALIQALVAILIVSIVALILKATAATMNALTAQVEMASFAVVALMGGLITWRKAGKVLGVVALARNPLATAQEESCDHVHLPPPESFDRLTKWREMAGVSLAAGIRPCAGALIVLVFALSQGVFAAGIASTFAMALGTALTTGAIAALAVFAKSLALKVAGGRGVTGALTMAGIELLAAAFVLVLGLSLLFGFMSSAIAS